MASVDNKSLPHDTPSVTLTIRLLMAGKEVGSIIGKKGEIVKRFRDESGARINISDGSCPERIVTITGSTEAIFKAFNLICKKLEEEVGGPLAGTSIPRPPITLRLIMPASQCGSLIGKGGSKIKEIREITGASVVVASEMLPNSTERAVTVSGTSEAITQCIYHICCVMLESPPKGATIPYRPKPQVGGPVILAGGQAYTIQGNYAVPATPDVSKLAGNPLANLAALGLGGLSGSGGASSMNASALAALAGSQLRSGANGAGVGAQQSAQQQTQEMTVPNELIGCIIGKGGTKIAEIRQISGAMIRISNCEDRESSTERTITITGATESVALAQYLINTSVELHKANMESRTTGGEQSGQTTVAATAASSALANALPLAQLLAKPGALSALGLSGLTALTSLSDLLTGTSTQQQASPIQTTGVHRSGRHSGGYEGKVRSSAGSSSPPTGVKKDRNKFAPY